MAGPYGRTSLRSLTQNLNFTGVMEMPGFAEFFEIELMANEVAFGDFRLDLGRRKLTQNGAPVRLSGRAVDVLCSLAAARGQIVSNDELIQRVSGGGAVGDNNLHVHISALRKIFDTDDGAGFLV